MTTYGQIPIVGSLPDISYQRHLAARGDALAKKCADRALAKPQRLFVSSLARRAAADKFKGFTTKQYHSLARMVSWLEQCEGKLNVEIIVMRRGHKIDATNDKAVYIATLFGR